MQRIKVLIANRPRLMRELVTATISDQPDIEILGVVEEESSILEIVQREHPDFLIVAADGSERRPAICDAVFDRHPHMCILALSAEQDCTIFYWANVEIRSNRIENSEQGILTALRGRKLLTSILPNVAHNRSN